MKPRHAIGLLLVCGAVALAGWRWADRAARLPQGAGLIAFVPPEMGVPASRIGAGSRSITFDKIGLHLMVPEGGGLTAQPAPILLWKLDSALDGRVSLDLRPVSGARIYTTTLRGDFAPGYMGADLAGADVALEPGTIYQWTVKLSDGDYGGVITTKTQLIERISPPADMVSAAESGLWYDAVGPLVVLDQPIGPATITDAKAMDALLGSAGLTDQAGR